MGLVTSGIPIESFWGKLASEQPDAGYHPLICHLIDVACVAEALWRRSFTAPLRSFFADALEMEQEDAARWIAFWAGLHDLGKLSPAFQFQGDGWRQRLADLGLPIPYPPASARHGVITTRVLPAVLTSAYEHSPSLADAVATVIGGHHGVFPRSLDLRHASSNARGTGPWEAARLDVARMLADVVGLPSTAPVGQLSRPHAMVLAGLVSIADWIGSNVTFFPFAAADLGPPARDLLDYAQGARAASTRALEELGWIGWEPPGAPASFVQLFPAIPRANEMQNEVIALADDRCDRVGLVVIEAPMGEGKSEAAMYLADRWSAIRGQSGAYIALPTQATSNQMYGRVREMLRRRYPGGRVNLQLLHGHAVLSAEFRTQVSKDSLYSIDGVCDEESDSKANVVAAEWFTYRKRGLLAPFGVGTVDQALLAVLQTRHMFVRLFGLAQKTVIVDEVHAYDAYMSTLLERLLHWLGALGCSVVLLSATLPRERLAKLVGAYARARGSATEVSGLRPYPRISWFSDTALTVRHVETSARSKKQVRLRRFQEELPETGEQFELGRLLREMLQGGGCAAIICNTVGRAQRTYEALQPFFGEIRNDGSWVPDEADDGEPVLDILHARFRFNEREDREQRALRRFGKPGGLVEGADGPVEVRRPARAVLVATQVIEQSLDLDFDIVTSELAPVDLLLQRAGRLHRHDRPRPALLTEPQLWIWEVSGAEPRGPVFEPGTRAVYDEHVLLRSWLALAGRTEVRVPDDVEELIEFVYDGRPCPSGVDETLRERWEDTRSRQQMALERDEAKARTCRILPPWDEDLFEDRNQELDEDDPEVHVSLQALTRLGDPSAPVVLLTLGDREGCPPVARSPSLPESRWFLRRSCP